MKNYCFHIIIFLSIFCANNTGFSQGTWETIDVPTTQRLHSVCFVDSLYGWAVGDSGTIIHTADGGENWIIQESQLENEIVNVFFLNKNLGWAASYKFDNFPYGTYILKTTDGGQNWTHTLYPEENIFITCILFQDSLNGWMGGRPHTLVNTTNGGIDWQQADVDTSVLAFFPILNIQFYDENYGYACGGMFDIAGVIWRTNNGGEKWYALDPMYAPADEVHQLHLYDSIHVMGAGGDPDFGYGVAFMRTWDGGIDWEYEELGVQGNAFDLDFRTDAEAWCPLGPRRKLIFSLDSGTTWTQINTPDSTAIFDVSFPDSLHGYAVGQEGAFIRYNPPFPVSVEFDYLFEANEILQTQNYPNPFNSQTRIKFKLNQQNGSIMECSYVELNVFNTYGKLVSTFVKSELNPGNNYFDFDASFLPAGVYYYKLVVSCSGNEKPITASQRMILMK